MKKRFTPFDGLITNFFALVDGLGLIPRLDDLELDLSLPEIERDLENSAGRHDALPADALLSQPLVPSAL